MKTSTPTMGGPQWLALLAGLTCAGITAANLVGEAIAGGTFGLEQANLLGLLFVTVAAGLLGKATRRGYSAVFYAVFVAGTVLVVYNSAGRQHGAEAGAVAKVAGANKALADLAAERKTADVRVAELRSELARFAGVRSAVEVKAALDNVVGDKPGKVPVAVWRRTNGCAATEITKHESAAACQPVLDLRVENGKAIERETLKRRLDDVEAKRTALVQKIGEMPAEAPLPVKARGFAEALSVLGADPARVEAVMSRLDKVLLALVLELGAIFGLEYALAGLMTRRPAEAPAAPAQPVPAAPKRPTPPKGTGRRGRKGDEKVIAFAAAYKARNGRAPSGSEIQAAFPALPKSTAYDYAKRAA